MSAKAGPFDRSLHCESGSVTRRSFQRCFAPCPSTTQNEAWRFGVRLAARWLLYFSMALIVNGNAKLTYVISNKLEHTPAMSVHVHVLLLHKTQDKTPHPHYKAQSTYQTHHVVVEKTFCDMRKFSARGSSDKVWWKRKTVATALSALHIAEYRLASKHIVAVTLERSVVWQNVAWGL